MFIAIILLALSGNVLLTSTVAQYCTQRDMNGITRRTCCWGFKATGDLCVPMCYKDCPNGVCVKPSTCVCNSGYVRSNVTRLCEPICAPTCENGRCLAPNSCECNAGYALSEGNICKPICERDCTNGECVAPNLCIRKEYTHNMPVITITEPICETACINAHCVGRNTCACNEGYTTNDGKECQLENVATSVYNQSFIYLIGIFVLLYTSY